MASDLVRFSVAIPRDLLEEFDAYASRRGIMSNRSEAIRDLMRDRLVEEEIADLNTEVVGSITMVYDHHAPDLAYRLDHIQHHHVDQIISTTHVHLDHSNCLEILAVRGTGSEIRELADTLLGTKGVRHGQLVCTTIA